jgi:hypothetical protein
MGWQFLILFFANLAIETTSSGISYPSITHGKVTRVEQKLKLSVLLAKEDYQFGKQNRNSVSNFIVFGLTRLGSNPQSTSHEKESLRLYN